MQIIGVPIYVDMQLLEIVLLEIFLMHTYNQGYPLTVYYLFQNSGIL